MPIDNMEVLGHVRLRPRGSDDPRERDERNRDRDPVDPRDAFLDKLDLPRGLERELVRDRDREYSLRERDDTQTFYAELKKAREVEHDVQIHRAHEEVAERLAERGATVERVVLTTS
jgi:hypothetical protein